jgi:uncharacterized protein (DUF952 family)
MTLIYKLLDSDEWDEALSTGRYDGSAADLTDGFIHFSTADQLAETARRHFRARRDLVCFAVEAETLPALRWEPSRGGALFPHLHGTLDPALVVDAWPVPLGEDGDPKIEIHGR